ncbi:hypothetical protein C8R47DRAFT_1214005 [Mycena vitilis]|nr:hypothetical protein C8R47DRAFT_1214005 [Mycena vitilis]
MSATQATGYGGICVPPVGNNSGWLQWSRLHGSAWALRGSGVVAMSWHVGISTFNLSGSDTPLVLILPPGAAQLCRFEAAPGIRRCHQAVSALLSHGHVFASSSSTTTTAQPAGPPSFSELSIRWVTGKLGVLIRKIHIHGVRPMPLTCMGLKMRQTEILPSLGMPFLAVSPYLESFTFGLPRVDLHKSRDASN